MVKGDPEAPFSITTRPKCRGGHHSFPLIAPLTPDPHLIVPYKGEC